MQNTIIKEKIYQNLKFYHWAPNEAINHNSTYSLYETIQLKN